MFRFRPLIKEKYDCITSKLPNAFYYDFSNTSGTGFIYSLIRKAQEDGRKDMTLLLDDKKHVRICRKEFPTKDDDAADII
jgi:hypothetical protein